MDILLYKKILKQKKMTYEDLSKLSGLSLSCIRKIMSGAAQYPRIDTIEAIEGALGLSSDITPEERAAGVTATKTVKITPIEDDMLYVFREVGKKRGEAAQRAIVEMVEKML